MRFKNPIPKAERDKIKRIEAIVEVLRKKLNVSEDEINLEIKKK